MNDGRTGYTDDRGYRARRRIAGVLFVLSLLVYLALTIICAYAFSQSRDVEGAEVIGRLLLVSLFLQIGSGIYAGVAVLNVIALLLLNIKKPEKGFKGIPQAALAVAAVATYFIFIGLI